MIVVAFVYSGATVRTSNLTRCNSNTFAFVFQLSSLLFPSFVFTMQRCGNIQNRVIALICHFAYHTLVNHIPYIRYAGIDTAENQDGFK